MSAPAGLIFDKDGTLFDFTASWAPFTARVVDAFSGGDAALAERLAAALGFDRQRRVFDPRSPVIAGTARDAARALSRCLPGADVDALERRLAAGAVEEIPVAAVPLAPLMERLRAAGLALAVMTNDAEAAARAHLDAAGALDAFDIVIGYDSGHGAKPDPAPLLACAAALGLAPARLVMIGDSLHDLTAARDAGMRGVGVLTGPAGAEDLAPHCEIVLPDIGHLPAWLETAAR